MMVARVIDNAGCGKCLLMEEKNGVGLIASPDKGEIIVAYMDKDDPNLWHSGAYFKNHECALLEFKARIRINRA